MRHLLVAQPEGKRQCEHGISLIQRWRRRQLLKVGICKAPLLGAWSWLTANGLDRQLDRLGKVGSDSGCEGPRHCRFPLDRTLSRVVARQLGLLAQVCCPARGSARVTS